MKLANLIPQIIRQLAKQIHKKNTKGEYEITSDPKNEGAIFAKDGNIVRTKYLKDGISDNSRWAVITCCERKVVPYTSVPIASRAY